MVNGHDDGSRSLEVLGHLDVHAQLRRSSGKIIDLGYLAISQHSQGNEARNRPCQMHRGDDDVRLGGRDWQILVFGPISWDWTTRST